MINIYIKKSMMKSIIVISTNEKQKRIIMESNEN